MKQGRQRNLQPVQGYCHLYYEDPVRNMKQRVIEGYAEHLANLKEDEKPMGKINYCMQFAREMYAQEPPEVKERVMQYCNNVGNPLYEEMDEFTNYPREEQTRLANALITRR